MRSPIVTATTSRITQPKFRNTPAPKPDVEAVVAMKRRTDDAALAHRRKPLDEQGAARAPGPSRSKRCTGPSIGLRRADPPESRAHWRCTAHPPASSLSRFAPRQFSPLHRCRAENTARGANAQALRGGRSVLREYRQLVCQRLGECRPSFTAQPIGLEHRESLDDIGVAHTPEHRDHQQIRSREAIVHEIFAAFEVSGQSCAGDRAAISTTTAGALWPTPHSRRTDRWSPDSPHTARPC